MATTTSQHKEGSSSVRPPLFDGTNYGYWKVRMTIFLQSMDLEIWRVVSEKYQTPSTDFSQWTDEEKKTASLNAKAMNALYCGVDKVEFNRISQCSTANEIWHTLLVTHEGTSKVKESKIASLVHKFELFKMKQNESVSDMVTRMTDITNTLKSLGKEYSQVDLVRKILRCLTPEWERKTTAIEEANDLNTLTLEDLVGNLMAYEVQLQDRQEEEPKKRSLAFKATSDSENSEEDEDEDIALITRQFRRFIKKGRFQRKVKKVDSSIPNEVKCFNCKKAGHIKKDCPLLKFKPKDQFKKKKAFQACWDDSDSSSDEESNEEVANMCFVAQEDSVSQFDYDELFEAFNDLYAKFKSLSSKNKELKSENSTLGSQNKVLLQEIEDLKKENSCQALEIKEIEVRTNLLQNEIFSLKEKSKDLLSIVTKFTNGQKNLEKLLGSQRCSVNKTGLGYSFFDTQNRPNYMVKNQRHHSQPFVQRTKISSSNRNTSNYGNSNAFKHRHDYFSNVKSFYRKNTYYQRKPKSKWIWVPKTNSHGPKNEKGSNALFDFVVGTQNKKQMDIGQRLFQTYDWKAGVIFNPPK
jgi:hypothetical protein